MSFRGGHVLVGPDISRDRRPPETSTPPVDKTPNNETLSKRTSNFPATANIYNPVSSGSAPKASRLFTRPGIDEGLNASSSRRQALQSLSVNRPLRQWASRADPPVSGLVRPQQRYDNGANTLTGAPEAFGLPSSSEPTDEEGSYPLSDSQSSAYTSRSSNCEAALDSHHSYLQRTASDWHQEDEMRFLLRDLATRPSPRNAGATTALPPPSQPGGSWITHVGAGCDYSIPHHRTSLDSTRLATPERKNVLSAPHANVLDPHYLRPGPGIHGTEPGGNLYPPALGSKGHHSNVFHPMTVLSESEQPRNPLSEVAVAQYLQPDLSGDLPIFSRDYHGIHNEANASANIPNDENCSLWLTKLPPDVSYRELIDMIVRAGPFGRIFCTYLNYPDNMKHQTAAAKVVFFDPSAAQRALAHSWTSGLSTRGHRVMVTHNRIKAKAFASPGRASRVLLVTGHADFVNEDTLTRYFREKFIFQLDDVKVLIRAGDRAVLEYRFGSYRCQSQMAKMALERERPVGFEKAEFGDDPCEHGETYSSYGIAAERIQGRGIKD